MGIRANNVQRRLPVRALPTMLPVNLSQNEIQRLLQFVTEKNSGNSSKSGVKTRNGQNPSVDGVSLVAAHFQHRPEHDVKLFTNDPFFVVFHAEPRRNSRRFAKRPKGRRSALGGLYQKSRVQLQGFRPDPEAHGFPSPPPPFESRERGCQNAILHDAFIKGEFPQCCQAGRTFGGDEGKDVAVTANNTCKTTLEHSEIEFVANPIDHRRWGAVPFHGHKKQFHSIGSRFGGNSPGNDRGGTSRGRVQGCWKLLRRIGQFG